MWPPQQNDLQQKGDQHDAQACGLGGGYREIPGEKVSARPYSPHYKAPQDRTAVVATATEDEHHPDKKRAIERFERRR